MKLLFSEARPDYAHYVFPYAVWAFPEPGETPADLFEQGFLPSSGNLDRFYLCRHLRVRLSAFQASSENRRILRKGAGISLQLLPRAEFQCTPQRREFYQTYAHTRFGNGVMPQERLDSLFASRLTSHVLLFVDQVSGLELGAVTLFVERPRLAYYYFAFYDLACLRRNLGMFMMTSAVDFFARQGFQFVYLGSCYSRSALYKTQFAGIEFFNGVCWSANLEELKYLVDRSDFACHLLESEDFRTKFHAGELSGLLSASRFRVKPTTV